jgi:hypothetical protein
MVDTGSPELLRKKNGGCARLKHFKVKEIIYKFLFPFIEPEFTAVMGNLLFISHQVYMLIFHTLRIYRFLSALAIFRVSFLKRMQQSVEKVNDTKNKRKQ